MSDLVPTSPEGHDDLDLAIQDLQSYRQRLVQEVLSMGQKLKLPQARVDRDLIEHPEIREVDQLLSQLSQQRSGSVLP